MQELEQRPVRLGPVLPEARRRSNRAQSIGDLRCECGRRAAAPDSAGAEAHRGVRDGFLVVPGHHGHNVVVAASDRFFSSSWRGAGRRDKGAGVRDAARASRSLGNLAEDDRREGPHRVPFVAAMARRFGVDERALRTVVRSRATQLTYDRILSNGRPELDLRRTV